AGIIVVAPGEAGDAPGSISSEQKETLDVLHLRKIDLADRVLVANPGGYVVESTSKEIAYARANGKPVSFTDPVSDTARHPRVTVRRAQLHVEDELDRAQ